MLHVSQNQYVSLLILIEAAAGVNTSRWCKALNGELQSFTREV